MERVGNTRQHVCRRLLHRHLQHKAKTEVSQTIFKKCLVVLTVYLAAGRGSNGYSTAQACRVAEGLPFSPNGLLPQFEQYGDSKSMPDKAKESQKQPNILVIWGDDIGINNLSCYSHGVMGYKTGLTEVGIPGADVASLQNCKRAFRNMDCEQTRFRT
jgi:hypothetical protein